MTRSFLAFSGCLIWPTSRRYRTPLCILYPPKITATACFVLAQRIFDGPNSPSLDARISAASPSASLPTPPSHKSPSPDASRRAIEHFSLSETELSFVSEALGILLEFYGAQDAQCTYPYLSSIVAVQPPTASLSHPRLYSHVSEFFYSEERSRTNDFKYTRKNSKFVTRRFNSCKKPRTCQTIGPIRSAET